MLHLTRELVTQLANDEEILFLLDLQDLIPDILDEYLGRLLEDQLKKSNSLSDCNISRDERNIYITKKSQEKRLFDFAILYGQDGESPFYGIIGPWDKRINNKSVDSLYNKLVSDHNFTAEWFDSKSKHRWVYKPFSKNKEEIFTAIRNGLDPIILANQIINELLGEIDVVKLLIGDFKG